MKFKLLGIVIGWMAVPLLVSAQTPIPPDVKVGLGSKTPRGSFDINGGLYVGEKLFVEKIGTASTSIPLIGINKNKQVLKVAPKGTTDVTPVNMLTYELYNLNGDWINDFDTKIPANDYVVTIAGFYLKDPVVATNNNTAMTPLRIETWQANGTWHLALDYVGSAAPNNASSTWNLYVLIMNKSLARKLNDVTVDLKGSDKGAATGLPPGL